MLGGHPYSTYALIGKELCIVCYAFVESHLPNGDVSWGS